MTPKEIRRALAVRRRALGEEVHKLKTEASNQVEKHPLVQKERRKRRARKLLMGFVGLLLLFLIRCDCGSPPITATPDGGTSLEEPKTSEKTPPAKPKPVAVKVSGKNQPVDRAEMGMHFKRGPVWLDSFRLQVLSRSTRLAECFKGTERPGALRWSGAVSSAAGTVAEHSIEAVGGTYELSAEQRTCLVQVLTTPRYQLTPASPDDLPERVGLVIEF